MGSNSLLEHISYFRLIINTRIIFFYKTEYKNLVKLRRYKYLGDFIKVLAVLWLAFTTFDDRGPSMQSSTFFSCTVALDLQHTQ